MSLEGSVRCDHLWKRFRADRKRRPGLRDQLNRVKRLATGKRPRWRWALRDITFEVGPGESVGLVGLNGSGKSTLLKCVARTMYPTAGTVTVGGRVGALIEIRAGIHPLLSGRENIYLYGGLLGLRRHEIASRFDDIVTFAELEEAIDRQVKYYSSGMKMRLGFAVAAYLDPDVLLVDEVLAVGDAAFQQKCLDRMRHVLDQGTTLVFVSHDLAAVEAMCNRGLWMRDGHVAADGLVRETLAEYRDSIERDAEAAPQRHGLLRLVKTEVAEAGGGQPVSGGTLETRFVVESPDRMPGTMWVGISEGPAPPVVLLHRDLVFPAGPLEVRCRIPRLPLPRGRYYVWLGIYHGNRKELFGWHPVGQFDVGGRELKQAPKGIVRLAPITVDAHWETDLG